MLGLQNICTYWSADDFVVTFITWSIEGPRCIVK